MEERVEKIIREIKERGLTGYKIAEETTLTEVGINKILNGTSKKPRESTLVILEKYLHNNLGKEDLLFKLEEPDERYLTTQVQIETLKKELLFKDEQIEFYKNKVEFLENKIHDLESIQKKRNDTA